jgi:hypothetical protein
MSDTSSLGKEYLLAETSNVLQRINYILEVQGHRMKALDEKVISFQTANATCPNIAASDAALGDDLHEGLESLQPKKGSTSDLASTVTLSSQLKSGGHSTGESDISSGTHAAQPLNCILLQESPSQGPLGDQSALEHDSAQESQAAVNTVAILSTIENMPSATVGTPSKTANSFIPPPVTKLEKKYVELYGDDLKFYSKFAAPESWIVTRSLGQAMEVKYDTKEAQQLWSQSIGNLWTIPPDGRIEMTFQRHILERLEKDEAIPLLEGLRQVVERLEYRSVGDALKRGSFRVMDYDFDPDFEISVAEYGGDIPVGKFMEPFRGWPYGCQVTRDTKSECGEFYDRVKFIDDSRSAPWKRIM